MKKFVFAIILALVSNLGLAEDFLLVKATNDEDNEICKLYLKLNEKKDISKFRVEKTIDGEVISDKDYELDEGSSGVVMSHQRGRNIVTLYSKNFSSHNGGDLILQYLVNGITGFDLKANLDLQRLGDEWALFMEGKKATHLHFISNRKMFVGTIGVHSIKVVN